MISLIAILALFQTVFADWYCPRFPSYIKADGIPKTVPATKDTYVCRQGNTVTYNGKAQRQCFCTITQSGGAQLDSVCYNMGFVLGGMCAVRKCTYTNPSKGIVLGTAKCTLGRGSISVKGKSDRALP